VFAPGAYSDARRYASEIGWPLVVKPREGGKAQGVSVDVRSGPLLQLAFESLEHEGYAASEFMIQRSVPGRAYRILASRKRAYGAYCFLPASVTGDGRSTIERLIVMKNRRRRRNPHLGTPGRAIVLNSEAESLLADVGLLPTSVPTAGTIVSLSKAGNPNRGGDTVEVTHELAPAVEAIAVRAVQAIPGLDYGGVDIMLPRGHRGMSSADGCAVLEVNCGSELGGHLYPMYGAPNNVCRGIVADTAMAAGFTPNWPAPDSLIAVAVRLIHPRDPSAADASWSGLGRVRTQQLICRDEDMLAVMFGDPAAIYAVMHEHLARDWGTVIALRVDTDGCQRDVSWLEERLNPAPFLPLRHAEALSAWAT